MSALISIWIIPSPASWSAWIVQGLEAASGYAFRNPAYVLAAELGLAFGIFYGFDGWSGSTNDVEFKESPRVKNLIWLVSGAVAAIFGDLKALDPYAVRAFVLLVYTSFAVLGIGVVVVLYGFLVLLDSYLLRKSLGVRYGWIDAIGDYIHFGYRSYRDRKQDFAEDQRDRFHHFYLKQLTYSLLAAGSRKSVDQKLITAREILAAMTAVISEFRGTTREGSIRTNFMLVEEFASDRRVKFLPVGAVPTKVLSLAAYDTDQELGELRLPLPLADGSGSVPLLPGAPMTFVDGVPFIADDTRDLTYDGVPPQVANEMREYFDKRKDKFLSFASLRILSKNGPLGVVNVDCSETCVFGTRDEQYEIAEYLLPLCQVLGILYAEG